MESLVRRIKEKKELSGIDGSIVLETLKNYFKKTRINPENLTPKEQNLVIKDIRAELRKYSGRFQASLKERRALLETNQIKELLETHSSTKERIDFYPKLKKIISELDIHSILDLGCGLNPIALANPKIKYYALDINSDELSLVKEYFNLKNIDGEILVHDLRKPMDFPASDLCIIFKVFDVIENHGHKLAERIISSLKSKYLLISFPTKTLSNAPMRHPQRGWIEWLLSRLDFSLKTFKSKNEIFYLAEKINMSRIAILEHAQEPNS